MLGNTQTGLTETLLKNRYTKLLYGALQPALQFSPLLSFQRRMCS